MRTRGAHMMNGQISLQSWQPVIAQRQSGKETKFSAPKNPQEAFYIHIPHTTVGYRETVLPLTVGCGGPFKQDLMFLYVDLTELIHSAQLYLITLKGSVADAHFSLSGPQTLIGKCIAQRYFENHKSWSTVLDSAFDINCQATAGQCICLNAIICPGRSKEIQSQILS